MSAVADRSCDDEPIHTPGSIQPFGVMLAADSAGWVRSVSANVHEILGVGAGDLLGKPLKDLPGCDRRPLIQGSGIQLCELEPTPAYQTWTLPAGPTNLHEWLNDGLHQIERASSVQEMCDAAVVWVQRLTGFGRVMLYRFDEHWHGEVIAEATIDSMDTYMGQHFPASDIPRQARRMLRENRLRIIPNALYEPVPMQQGTQAEGTVVDMSTSVLRSVSPVHLEYLKNMGVQASLTVSLVLQGKLWGLIACHHATPRYASRPVRDACEILGRALSAVVLARAQQEEKEQRSALMQVHVALQNNMSKQHDFIASLTQGVPCLLEMVPSAAGAAVHFDGRWNLVGEVPPIDAMGRLVGWLARSRADQDVYWSSHLQADYADAPSLGMQSCGLIAMSLPKSGQDCVLWFLPELIQTINWAGNPQKNRQDAQGFIHPRTSFAMWRDELRGHSRAPTSAELEIVAQLRKSIVELDLTRQFQSERSMRADKARERHHLAFLAESSAVLAASLDYETQLRKFAALAAEYVCTWCVIYLRRDDGSMERVVVAHTTAQGQEVANDLLKFPALVGGPESPLEPVFSGNRAVLVPRVSWEWCRQVNPAPGYADFVSNKLGIRSVLVIPVKARDELLGVLKLVRAETCAPFSQDDQRWSSEVARRVAHAIDNALLYKRSQQAIQARDHVLGVVSHDLRNPLGALQLNAQRLQRLVDKHAPHALAVQLSTSLVRIGQAGRRMEALIEDILSLAKIEGGQFSVERVPVAAESLLREAFDMLEPLASARALRLDVSATEPGLQVMCEPERLLQVFSNLVGNAIKFTPAGGRVSIHLEECDAGVEFCVRDTGPGIAADDRPHVFDRFWQAGRAKRQGAGLGLAIVKGIVEAHGGEIWVESHEGRGSAFYFTLPA